MHTRLGLERVPEGCTTTTTLHYQSSSSYIPHSARWSNVFSVPGTERTHRACPPRHTPSERGRRLWSTPSAAQGKGTRLKCERTSGIYLVPWEPGGAGQVLIRKIQGTFSHARMLAYFNRIQTACGRSCFAAHAPPLAPPVQSACQRLQWQGRFP